MSSSRNIKVKRDRSAYSARIYPRLSPKKSPSPRQSSKMGSSRSFKNSISPKMDDIREPSPLDLDNISFDLDKPVPLKVKRSSTPHGYRLHHTRKNAILEMFGFRKKSKVVPVKGGKTRKNKNKK